MPADLGFTFTLAGISRDISFRVSIARVVATVGGPLGGQSSPQPALVSHAVARTR